MDKEEILKKSRIEFKNNDEREKLIDTKAFVWGSIGLATVFLVLAGVNIFIKGERIFDILAMFEAFLAAYYLYKYKMLKKKMDLFMMLMWAIASLLNIFSFIISV